MSIDLGNHAGFILGSYIVTILVIAAMIAWVILDHRAQSRRLKQLEERGARRRSERQAPAGTAKPLASRQETGA
ncbi:heme exporter protein CcmD [Hartmannibacter diazotrophicus]|uniref:Heme exporter protein D n=1 Tax=Hartmannibacter diazotrophicus TaxID=1482074 RepID=A0A2C9DBH5_9HYPH|nr:heme exporter protein CcmD [Hartmannibacter diazotrophicus]SON57674.1 heme exporter protein CcmD [Hartmannibacter diazotrophicus]